MMDYFPENPWSCRCGCGYDVIQPDLVARLNRARELAGVPFAITSACRCPKHNRAVGGHPNSGHVKGAAVDIRCDSVPTKLLILGALLEAGFRRIGIAANFVHADIMPEPSPRIWTY